MGRHEGERLCVELDRARRTLRFDDGRYRLIELRAGTPEGHVVRLDRARALAALLWGVLAEGASSPVSAPFLPAVPPQHGA